MIYIKIVTEYFVAENSYYLQQAQDPLHGDDNSANTEYINTYI